MAKNDLATRADNGQELTDLLASGLTSDEIVKWAAKKNWKVTPHELRRLLDKARQTLIDNIELDPAMHLALAHRRLDMLFARMMQVQDFKGALAVEREHIALFNLRDAVEAARDGQLRDANEEAEADNGTH